jgi:hypothetical protein
MGAAITPPAPSAAPRSRRNPSKFLPAAKEPYLTCTNREIGRYFGAISYSAVTKAKDRFEKVLLSDRTMRRIFEKIRGGISRFKG